MFVILSILPHEPQDVLFCA